MYQEEDVPGSIDGGLTLEFDTLDTRKGRTEGHNNPQVVLCLPDEFSHQFLSNLFPTKLVTFQVPLDVLYDIEGPRPLHLLGRGRPLDLLTPLPHRNNLDRYRHTYLFSTEVHLLESVTVWYRTFPPSSSLFKEKNREEGE